MNRRWILEVVEVVEVVVVVVVVEVALAVVCGGQAGRRRFSY